MRDWLERLAWGQPAVLDCGRDALEMGQTKSQNYAARRSFVSEGVPILLLPGMAADERLFESQLAQFGNLRVPAWIDPLPNESLRAYAIRLAQAVNPGCPCIVGGASFGGIVALEMAAHLQTLACVLIGSVRTPTELPWRWRVLRPFAVLGPGCLRAFAGAAAWFGRPVLARGTVRRLQHLSQPEKSFVRWAICAVLRWSPSPAARDAHVFHIHGEADQTFPVALTHPDVIVPGGAHALSLFSPTAVNDFLANVVGRVASH